MEDLRNTVDEKLVASMEKFWRILLTIVGNQRPTDEIVPNRSGGRRFEDEEDAPEVARGRRDEGYHLSDWLYQCEQYFEVTEAPTTSIVN